MFIIMRKDIEIHINTGDVNITRQNSYKKREFRWVNNPSGLSRYIYGEVDIPGAINEHTIRHGNAMNIGGFYFAVPYTPKYKEMMIRVRRVFDDGRIQYIMNETDGSEWHLVKVAMYGGEKKNAYASQLRMLSEECLYGRINGGVIDLYGCEQSDFNIIPADRQNANCMLACHPSNNYRYPLTGVGLNRWINANNIQSSALAERIMQEFLDDGVYVNNAEYDYETHQMSLDINAVNTD
nr:MAG TPA: hypothetical protein [Bacteriophage sp.]